VTEGNQDEALNRELNLTWQDKRPDHNPITAGTWPPKAGEVSMEEGLAKRLNVEAGSVTFTGDTQDFSAKVTSLRKVDWESLRPNFFFIFPGRAGRAAAELADQLPLGERQRYADPAEP
jgi:putative ABC transport system permease protein